MDETTLCIDEENLLYSSINELDQKYIRNSKIKIEYMTKTGDTYNATLKDWLSEISDIIKESGAFVLDSSGSSYIIDEVYYNSLDEIYALTGKVLGIAFNNNEKIDIKFSSIIWKLILGKELELDDMEYFDFDVYEKLKKVKENDVTLMNLKFVDYYGDELIKDGENVKVTNENKDEYIEWLLNRIIFNGINVDKLELVKEFFEDAVIASKYEDLNVEDIYKLLSE